MSHYRRVQHGLWVYQPLSSAMVVLLEGEGGTWLSADEALPYLVASVNVATSCGPADDDEAQTHGHEEKAQACKTSSLWKENRRTG